MWSKDGIGKRGRKMKRITFRFKDVASHGEWRTQRCTVESVEECKRIYGLDTDPTIYEYEIIEVEDIDH